MYMELPLSFAIGAKKGRRAAPTPYFLSQSKKVRQKRPTPPLQERTRARPKEMHIRFARSHFGNPRSALVSGRGKGRGPFGYSGRTVPISQRVPPEELVFLSVPSTLLHRSLDVGVRNGRGGSSSSSDAVTKSSYE